MVREKWRVLTYVSCANGESTAAVQRQCRERERPGIQADRKGGGKYGNSLPILNSALVSVGVLLW